MSNQTQTAHVAGEVNLTISVGPELEARRGKIGLPSADLSMHGWEKAEVTVTGTEGDARLEEVEGGFRIVADRSIEVHAPRTARITVERVTGDALVRGFDEELTIATVGGDLSVEDVAATGIELVGGDLRLEQIGGRVGVGRVGGDMKVSEVGGETRADAVGGDLGASRIGGSLTTSVVGGDLSARDIGGGLRVDAVGGDASLAGIAGDVALRAGGDIAARVAPASGGTVTLEAGGDLSAELPGDTNADVRVQSGGREVFVGLEATSREARGQGNRVFTVGSGGADVTLRAGGNVAVHGPDGLEDIGPRGRRYRRPQAVSHDDIEHSIEVMGEHLSQWGERFGRDMSGMAEELTRRVAHRLERAQEKAARRMERRTAAAGRARRSVAVGGPWPNSERHRGFTPSVQAPVSAEERRAVLDMLAGGKITADQADALLTALAGHSDKGSA